jgi:hypothetical protein
MKARTSSFTLSGTNLIIDVSRAAQRGQRTPRCRVASRLALATVHTVSLPDL